MGTVAVGSGRVVVSCMPSGWCWARGVVIVGADDALDEVVANDVVGLKVAELDALYAGEDVEGIKQTGFFGVGQVGLGEVAGDDGLGVVAEAGNEHLHLLDGGVLSLVHDDEGVSEGAAAHEGERGDLNHVALKQLIDLLLVEQVVERVVERAQVGVDFFLQRTGQEAEALAGFDRGADEDDAGDFFGHQRRDGHGDGEVGFAGAGRAEPEGHVMRFNGFDVLFLVGRARLHHALDAGGALLAGVDELAEGAVRRGDDELEQGVQLAVLQVDASLAQGVEVGEDLGAAGDGGFFAGNLDGVRAQVDLDFEARLRGGGGFRRGCRRGVRCRA